jgi:hypothetical protein
MFAIHHVPGIVDTINERKDIGFYDRYAVEQRSPHFRMVC